MKNIKVEKNSAGGLLLALLAPIWLPQFLEKKNLAKQKLISVDDLHKFMGWALGAKEKFRGPEIYIPRICQSCGGSKKILLLYTYIDCIDCT